MRGMIESREERRIFHGLFEISVILKGLHGSLETVLSFIIFFVNRDLARDVLTYLYGSGRGWAAHPALYLSHQVTPGAETFMGAYFLFFGVSNVFLAVNLLRNRLWAYPATIAFTSVFMCYEIYRLTHTHSSFLAGLIVFDAIVIALVWHEYLSRKKRAR